MDKRCRQPSSIEPVEKLTVCAQICLAAEEVPILVERDMVIFTKDGEEVGKVAAVLVNGRSQQPTHLVLARSVPEYRLVPICQVNRVSEDLVMLNISNQQLLQLPLHEPEP